MHLHKTLFFTPETGSLTRCSICALQERSPLTVTGTCSQGEPSTLCIYESSYFHKLCLEYYAQIRRSPLALSDANNTIPCVCRFLLAEEET